MFAVGASVAVLGSYTLLEEDVNDARMVGPSEISARCEVSVKGLEELPGSCGTNDSKTEPVSPLGEPVLLWRLGMLDTDVDADRGLLEIRVIAELFEKVEAILFIVLF